MKKLLPLPKELSPTERKVKCKYRERISEGDYSDEYWNCDKHNVIFETEDEVIETLEEGERYRRLRCPIMTGVFFKKPCMRYLYMDSLEGWKTKYIVEDTNYDIR